MGVETITESGGRSEYDDVAAGGCDLTESVAGAGVLHARLLRRPGILYRNDFLFTAARFFVAISFVVGIIRR
jgi:hypothetical protein